MTTEDKTKSDRLFYLLLFASLITAICIAFTSGATFDSGDGIEHYLIARYSWQHPKLLLDLWGKPVFTLISSPFAQFGLKGMYVFQALCALFTSVFLYKIANIFRLNFAWSLPAFIFFSPIYFAVIDSGLTEIMFGATLSLTFWLLVKNRNIAASVIASFILFVRPEGYLILPLIALLLALKKQWKALPFLFTSIIFFTAIGYPYYHNWLWIITNNYKTNGDVYNGAMKSFFHYFGKYNEIWGTIYSLLLLTGIGSLAFAIPGIISKRKESEFVREKVLLFMGSFFVILVLHSISCSVKGFVNNLGMVRYMTCLIPSSAMLALIGINRLSRIIKKYPAWVLYLFLLIVLLLIVITPFRQWYYPFRPNNEEAVSDNMSGWLKPLLNHRSICYLNPCITTAADIDPYDKSVFLMHGVNKNSIRWYPDSTFLIWDSHFSPQEGNTSLYTLLSDNNLKLVKVYRYYNETEPFDLWVFMKKAGSSLTTGSEQPVAGSLTIETVAAPWLVKDFYKGDSVSFSTPPGPGADSSMLSPAKSPSGKQSLFYSQDREYGPVFSKKLAEISDYRNFGMLKITFRLYPCNSMQGVKAVAEIKQDGKVIDWEGGNIPLEAAPNRWNTIKMTEIMNIKDNLNETGTVNFYFWNKAKTDFYIDSVRIGYYCSEK
jgi:hypothetical protein